MATVERFDAAAFLENLFEPSRGRTMTEPPPGCEPTIGPDDLPPEWREHHEERAAVREHAEAEALRETPAAMRRAGLTFG